MLFTTITFKHVTLLLGFEFQEPSSKLVSTLDNSCFQIPFGLIRGQKISAQTWNTQMQTIVINNL